MKRILVTGGAGFLGSHLCEHLLARGADVVCIDNFFSGSKDNIRPFLAHPYFEFIRHDVIHPLFLEVDGIYHLACPASPIHYQQNAIKTVKTNVMGTINMLGLAKRIRSRMLLTSTSEVYGKSPKVPFAETDDLVIGPPTFRRWSYATAKAVDEFLALAHWHHSRLPVVIVRLFNTVGPRQSGQYGMVIPRFVRQALLGRPITVYGDGSQTRCFCHVGDVVGALVALLDNPAAYGEIFNVGTDREISIRKLAEMVRAIAQSRSEIVHVPYQEAYGTGFEDMERRVPDLAKVRRLIGYEPRGTLEQTLEDVIRYVRGQLDTDPEIASGG